MITHEVYRKALLTDPHAADAELKEHRQSCAECAAYAQDLLRFEQRLQQALRLDVSQWRAPLPDAPERYASDDLAGAEATRDAVVLPFPGSRRTPRRGWLALAASVLLVLAGGGFWLTVPGYSLAADVVTHMAEEPQAWRATDVAVPDATLDSVLQASHVRLRPSAGRVSYASSCSFRGQLVPHLVVQTDAGPVTVMVLTHEQLHRKAGFDEQGYRGVIVPVPGHGSLAVLGRGSTANPAEVDATAARVLAALDYID